MTGRERFLSIAELRSEHCGFWHGMPHADALPKLYSYFGVKDEQELGEKLGSCCRHIRPEDHTMWPEPSYPVGYTQPPMFDVLGGAPVVSLDQPGCFADLGSDDSDDAIQRDLDTINNFHWPDAKNCDWTETLGEIDRCINAGQAVLCGTWGTFFRTTYCFFGMQNCFIKMYEAPELVDAVARHVVDFYLAANEIIYNKTKTATGNKIDALFFGNDFGTQQDLFISPELFDRFVMPYFKELVDQAHNHGIKVVLHSCGSIYRVIPRLIEAGVEILHPLQAKAKNMDAEYLCERYLGKIAFMGGLDAQNILPFGTADEIKKEVRRLKKTFGGNYIVSPSHETLLPNVPMENVVAMMETALE
jgi:uroporphyrinogen decarboxylase